MLLFLFVVRQAFHRVVGNVKLNDFAVQIHAVVLIAAGTVIGRVLGRIVEAEAFRRLVEHRLADLSEQVGILVEVIGKAILALRKRLALVGKP